MTDLSAPIKALAAYRPTHKVRFVTAASLFDGHDAAINIMRRLLMSMGAEVIHLGHNRSVDEVVTAALQEDVQGIAISSYQGGHAEYFKYVIDLLRQRGGAHIQVFGGGGGVIVPAEIRELQAYGVTRIYSPEDGQRMGLQGMIGEMVMRCDRNLSAHAPATLDAITGHEEPAWRALAQLITALENGEADATLVASMRARARADWIESALTEMRRSNRVAAQILMRFGATAMTDVTGFGLAGHLGEMLKASRASADLNLSAIPLYAGSLALARDGIASTLLPENLWLADIMRGRIDDVARAILFDPQTSGGLLAGIPATNAGACVAALTAAGYGAASIIGSATQNELSDGSKSTIQITSAFA